MIAYLSNFRPLRGRRQDAVLTEERHPIDSMTPLHRLRRFPSPYRG